MLKNFEEMAVLVKNNPTKKRVIVVGAHDEHTLEGVSLACKENIAEPVLIGDVEKIRKLISLHGYQLGEAELIESGNDVDAARTAVRLIHEGAGDFLMKGNMQTADLLREVVNKQTGLRTGSIMSHVALVEVPGYHKVVILTDVGMLPHPDLQQKVKIIDNAVSVLRSMGYSQPKVAVLAAAEVVNEKAMESVEAKTLKEMNLAGQIADCIVEGPISYDLAFSKEMAKFKKYSSPVAGDADIVVVPNLAAGNILGKALVLTAGGAMIGIVSGAKVPLVVASRGATAAEKYYSIVMAAAISR
ncbi:MAG: phosphate butyryltransferase [Desulfobulbus propionicus]|nr:MAG: phosphate butyryltransferase [Desulfobulbus propionicus]